MKEQSRDTTSQVGGSPKTVGQTPVEPIAYTTAEVCVALGISRTTLYELVCAGQIRTFRIGSRGIRIPASEISRFVSEGMERADESR